MAIDLIFFRHGVWRHDKRHRRLAIFFSQTTLPLVRCRLRALLGSSMKSTREPRKVLGGARQASAGAGTKFIAVAGTAVPHIGAFRRRFLGAKVRRATTCASIFAGGRPAPSYDGHAGTLA
jgi:hypothetical protein